MRLINSNFAINPDTYQPEIEMVVRAPMRPLSELESEEAPQEIGEAFLKLMREANLKEAAKAYQGVFAEMLPKEERCE